MLSAHHLGALKSHKADGEWISELAGHCGTVARGREVTWRPSWRANTRRWRREENRPMMEWWHNGRAKAESERQGRKGEKYPIDSVAEKGKGKWVYILGLGQMILGAQQGQ